MERNISGTAANHRPAAASPACGHGTLRRARRADYKHLFFLTVRPDICDACEAMIRRRPALPWTLAALAFALVMALAAVRYGLWPAWSALHAEHLARASVELLISTVAIIWSAAIASNALRDAFGRSVAHS